MTIFYFRTLKKLTYHLIKHCSTNNLYKRNVMSQYIIGFSESCISFLWAIDGEHSEIFDKTNFVKTLVEYSVMYFSQDKWEALIRALIKQNGWDQKFLKTQLSILHHRDVASKENIKFMANNSGIFRKLLRLALDVLSSGPHFYENTIGKELIKRTKYFLTL